MPQFILDGKEIAFTNGQTIIQAAADAGIEIPHFCWHPSLSVSGNCRVCLVEIEKLPKLMIACSTLAADGMVVHTNNEKTLAARKAVMEFILINHPLDCPICDEAGECKLQDYTYQHSIGESRFNELKNNKQKRVPLGPYVMFDGDRCISCSRCIRFCDEIAGKTELTFVNRGDRVTIATFPGRKLENPYSLNVTDICPVGALTNRDFRFKARVWEMSATKSICPGCSRGCNIDVWVRQNQILRLTPRYNADVNSYWMCDEGRINSFTHVNAVTRIDGPKIRKDGALKKITWDEAFSAAARELKAYASDEIGFLGSAVATLEDNYLLAHLAQKVIRTKNLDLIAHFVIGSGDDILIREDKSPNALGAEIAGVRPELPENSVEGILNKLRARKIRALFILQDDIVARYPEIEEHLAKLDLLILTATNENRTTSLANLIFPSATFAEKFGTWINFQGRVQKLRPSVATAIMDRSLNGLALSRLDKFGTEYDRWGQSIKIDARSDWRIVMGILAAMGIKLKFNSSDEVLLEMIHMVPELRGIDIEKIGEQGIQLQFKTQKV